jgi:hypothetical protein|tara:strand:+ start:431 stop:700 length:270 start_codon:yes stop_codon:yes gene_type:complete
MIKYIIIMLMFMGCASNPCPMYCGTEHEHKYSKKDKEFLDWYAKEFIKYKQTEREYRKQRQIADSLQERMVKEVISETDSVWFDTTGSK